MLDEHRRPTDDATAGGAEHHAHDARVGPDATGPHTVHGGPLTKAGHARHPQDVGSVSDDANATRARRPNVHEPEGESA